MLQVARSSLTRSVALEFRSVTLDININISLSKTSGADELEAKIHIEHTEDKILFSNFVRFLLSCLPL